MIELFKKELELCNVREGETVAVLSAGDSLRHYARDFIAAGQQLRAKMIDVHLPGKSDGLVGPAGRAAREERPRAAP